MYKAYVIKLYFTNGDWTYLSWGGGGRYYFTKDANNTMYFDTVQEAQDYYYEHIRGGVSENGSTIDWRRTAVVQVESQYPL